MKRAKIGSDDEFDQVRGMPLSAAEAVALVITTAIVLPLQPS